MKPTKKQLVEAMIDISFEMNRYLYTAEPKHPLPGRYREAVAESCLLHSRIIGEFFFGPGQKDDVLISHFYAELISAVELKNEIEKLKPHWDFYKKRTHKRLCHLTYSRADSTRMNMGEKEVLNFPLLIELFEKNLPEEYLENWNRGKAFSV